MYPHQMQLLKACVSENLLVAPEKVQIYKKKFDMAHPHFKSMICYYLRDVQKMSQEDHFRVFGKLKCI